MSGLTQSFNIGVAVGISLATAVRTRRFPQVGSQHAPRLVRTWRWGTRELGVEQTTSSEPSVSVCPCVQGSMPEASRAELLGRWLLRDIKGARTLLQQAGLEFEDF